MSDRLRVLYVGDDVGWPERRADTIEEAHGFDVIATADAADARSRLEEAHVDCALVDLNARDEGVELVGALRETRPGMPVVALVGGVSGDRVASALDAGATDYFSTAAFDVSEPLLAHRVRRAVAQHRESEDAASGSQGEAGAGRGSPADDVTGTRDAEDDLVAAVRAAFSDDHRDGGPRDSPTDRSGDATADPGEDERSVPDGTVDRTSGDTTAEASGFDFEVSLQPADTARDDADIDAGRQPSADAERPEPSADERGDERTSSGAAGHEPGRRTDAAASPDAADTRHDADDPDASAPGSPETASRSDRIAAPDPKSVPADASAADSAPDADTAAAESVADLSGAASESDDRHGAADAAGARDVGGPPAEPTGDATPSGPANVAERSCSTTDPVPDDLSPQEGLSVLVQGATRSERVHEACADLLGLGGDDHGNVLLVSYAPVDDARLERLAADAGRVTVVAVGYAPSVPAAVRDRVETVEVTPPTEVTRLGIVVTSTVRDWEPLDARTVVCYDSLNALLRYREADEAFRFLHLLLNQLHASGATSHFHADLQAGNPREIGTLKPLFDEAVSLGHD